MILQEEKIVLIEELVVFFGSQALLGKQVNVCQQTVSKWLRDETSIPPKKAIKLEKISRAIGKVHITAKKLTPELDWGA
jgi:DNA-binding transcriptional regulator YdaS (Cro superfamily)